jgi:Fe-S-cluster containining protein
MSPDKSAGTGSQPLDVCFRCGECCTRYQVLFEEPELERMAAFLGISKAEFVKEYTDPRWPITEKYLLRHRANGGCIFLVHQGRQALCSIHAAKPQPCIDWAPSFERKECAAGLGRVWRLTVTGSGELCGEEHDKKIFRDYLDSISE